MRKKSTWILFVCLAFFLSLIWADPTDAARKLKYGHNTKQDQPTGKAALKFAELVNHKTNGEIVIEVFPANQLGNNRQMAENVKMGAQDLTTMGLAALGHLNDNFMMMQVPYVFRSQEHIQKVVRGPVGESSRADLAKKDQIILLAMDWDRMVRHIGGRKVIRGLADLKGYKIRAGVLPPIAGFKALGASPVNIPLNEMYVALQQGVADGAELPVDYFYEYSIYEVAKYLNLTYHTYGTQFVGINKRLWESLKPEHQKALQEAANEAGVYNNKLVADLQEDYLGKLKKAGMEMIQTNVEELRNALKSKIPEITKSWPTTLEIYEQIQATN